MCPQVFRLSYPCQEQMKQYADIEQQAASSIYSMPHDLFYQLHPYHLLLDR